MVNRTMGEIGLMEFCRPVSMLSCQRLHAHNLTVMNRHRMQPASRGTFASKSVCTLHCLSQDPNSACAISRRERTTSTGSCENHQTSTGSTSTSLDIRIHIYIIYIYIYMYIYIYIYMCVFVCVYTCVCDCMFRSDLVRSGPSFCKAGKILPFLLFCTGHALLT